MQTTKGTKSDYGPHTINRLVEGFWVDHQPILLSRGYQLRARYQPDWKPSWIDEAGNVTKRYARCEDSLYGDSLVMDATRTADNQKVVLKKVQTNAEELPIGMFLSRPDLRADPRNCTVPILDVIILAEDDNTAIIVMPMLYHFHRLPFRRVGEFAEAALQLLQAVEFMHEHDIAHRDACRLNFMMDASKVIPKGAHFISRYSHDGVSWGFEWIDRWSVRPVNYYLTDFGISMRCPKDTLITGVIGQDRTPPELSQTAPYNPFMLDVYHAGNVIGNIIEEYDGLSVFKDLVKRMTARKPAERPTASQVVQRCEEIVAELNHRSLMKRRVWLRQNEKFFIEKLIERFNIKYRGKNPLLY